LTISLALVMAMADAKAKAEQLAELAGVRLGKPTYISEGIQIPPPSTRGPNTKRRQYQQHQSFPANWRLSYLFALFFVILYAQGNALKELSGAR